MTRFARASRPANSERDSSVRKSSSYSARGSGKGTTRRSAKSERHACGQPIGAFRQRRKKDERRVGITLGGRAQFVLEDALQPIDVGWPRIAMARDPDDDGKRRLLKQHRRSQQSLRLAARCWLRRCRDRLVRLGLRAHRGLQFQVPAEARQLHPHGSDDAGIGAHLPDFGVANFALRPEQLNGHGVNAAGQDQAVGRGLVL